MTTDASCLPSHKDRRKHPVPRHFYLCGSTSKIWSRALALQYPCQGDLSQRRMQKLRLHHKALGAIVQSRAFSPDQEFILPLNIVYVMLHHSQRFGSKLPESLHVRILPDRTLPSVHLRSHPCISKHIVMCPLQSNISLAHPCFHVVGGNGPR